MLSIPAGNPSPWTGPEGNNTYLLTGAVPTLIDAGVGEPAHIEAVGNALGGSALAQILITHSHPDHARGVPADLTVAGRAGSQPGTRLLRGQRVDPGRRYDPAGTSNAGPCARSLLPGRSHADVRRPREAGWDHRRTASAGGSLVQHLDSLRRIRALPPRRLLPGHGPVIDDPVTLIDSTGASGRARARCSTLCAWARRLLTPWSSASTRTCIPPWCARPADSVLAHLIKLRDEGRVMERDGEWRER